MEPDLKPDVPGGTVISNGFSFLGIVGFVDPDFPRKNGSLLRTTVDVDGVGQ